MPSPLQPGSRPLIEIRKYPNRRYYDTTRSQHVTLEGIRRLIREGHEVRIIDSRSSEEITPQVLIQIILDLESRKLNLFPLEFLTWMIRLNDSLAQEFLIKQLSQNIMSYMEWQRNLAQSYGRTPPSPFGTPFGGWSAMPPWSAMGGAPKAEAEGDTAGEEESEEALRRRIADLEARLARQAAGGTQPRPPRRRRKGPQQ